MKPVNPTPPEGPGEPVKPGAPADPECQQTSKQINDSPSKIQCKYVTWPVDITNLKITDWRLISS